MASAWGKSWGAAWNGAWGSIAAAVAAVGGGIGHGKASKNQYRLIRADDVDFNDVEELCEYIAEKVAEAETKSIKLRKTRKDGSKKYTAPPIIEFAYAPDKYYDLAKMYIERANEDIRRIWDERLKRKLEDREDDEMLVLLMVA